MGANATIGVPTPISGATFTFAIVSDAQLCSGATYSATTPRTADMETDGKYKVCVQATANGETGRTETPIFELDRMPPAAPANAKICADNPACASSDTADNDVEAFFVWSSAADADRFQIYLYANNSPCSGAETLHTAGAAPQAFTFPASGDFTFQVKALDKAGNKSELSNCQISAITVSAAGPGTFDLGDLVSGDGVTPSAANAVAVDVNNRFVVVGTHSTGAVQRARVARVKTDFTMDASFNGGYAMVGLPCDTSLTSNLHAVSIAPEGMIYAVGECYQGGNRTAVLLGLTTFGLGDATLAVDGVKILNISGDTLVEVAHAVLATSDAIYVAGYYDNGASNRPWFVRRLTRGGATTWTKTEFNEAQPQNSAFKLLLVGSALYVAGSSGSPAKATVLKFLTSDGSLDTSFNGNGKLKFRFDDGEHQSFAHSIVRLTNGNLLIGGSSKYESDFRLGLAVVNPGTGAFVNDFDTDGRAIKTIPDYGNDPHQSIITDSLDRIYAPVGSTTAPSDLVVARFDSAGTPDTDFGVSGLGSKHVQDVDIALGIAQAQEGSVAVVGTTQQPSDTNSWIVARLYQ